MQVRTKRFGTLDVSAEQIFMFPAGLIGMPLLKQWSLIEDSECPQLAWLQSSSRPELALPVVSPRAFFPDYQLRLSSRDTESLRVRSTTATYVLTTVSEHNGDVTTNLRAPILLNLEAHLGGQLTTLDEQPIRQALPAMSAKPIRLAA